MSGQDPDSPPLERAESLPAFLPDEAEEIPIRPVDPTRYGDWEKNGRCIDF